MFFDLFRKRITARTIDRSRILYQDGKRKMYISFEWVTPDGATQIDSYSIKRWESPYQNEIITEAEKQNILDNIKKELERKGTTVKIY